MFQDISDRRGIYHSFQYRYLFLTHTQEAAQPGLRSLSFKACSIKLAFGTMELVWNRREKTLLRWRCASSLDTPAPRLTLHQPASTASRSLREHYPGVDYPKACWSEVLGGGDEIRKGCDSTMALIS